MENKKVFDIKKRSFNFSLDVIKFLRASKSGYIDQVIGKQLIRCATSIGANIIEAQASSSKKDFANFYNHSLKSANETIYWLELIKHSSDLAVDDLLDEASQLSKILGKSLLTIRGK
jgi:four helix bundle protein